ncbi:hypothetical protein [Rhizobium sp. NXC24]|uniref:hypothetical protein n=1 Tax=Rhizobium sp. NXC24 TaxID=2048897 RepID=UPI001FE0FF5A|nr:hypothetical protein [Rhizobium sp. NXC24]
MTRDDSGFFSSYLLTPSREEAGEMAYEEPLSYAIVQQTDPKESSHPDGVAKGPSLDADGNNHDISEMSDIQPPRCDNSDPDRHLWCQYALHLSFAELLSKAVDAGWGEREVAAALVDLADHHMLGLITSGEIDELLGAIKKRS